MSSSPVARIRIAALQHNLDRVRQAAPRSRILAVVKADAYGHGLAQVAVALEAADAFAVARIEEGIRLRRTHPHPGKPVVVLSDWVDSQDLALARENHLELVVHTVAQIDLLASAPAATGQDTAIGIWLKVDSGMGRLGITLEEVGAAIGRLQACKSVAPRLRLMTHLACADEIDNAATPQQIGCFADAIGQWNGDVSIANSAAILAWPETLDAGSRLKYAGENWVRPGLMLYGISPFADRAAADLGLQPAMIFEGCLIAVRRLARGLRVGYGGDWRARRDSTIGVIDVGYGDGYPWRIGSGAPVQVAGTIAPIVGRISMDLISVDLTDISGAKTGDPVMLWGDSPTVSELAARAGTIPYELLTGVSPRVRRIYE